MGNNLITTNNKPITTTSHGNNGITTSQSTQSKVKETKLKQSKVKETKKGAFIQYKKELQVEFPNIDIEEEVK